MCSIRRLTELILITLRISFNLQSGDNVLTGDSALPGILMTFSMLIPFSILIMLKNRGATLSGYNITLPILQLSNLLLKPILTRRLLQLSCTGLTNGIMIFNSWVEY